MDAVCAAIEVDDNWDVAGSSAKLEFYILLAAQNVDRFPPFTDREERLNAYLEHRMGGKRMCDFAWRMLSHPRDATSTDVYKSA